MRVGEETQCACVHTCVCVYVCACKRLMFKRIFTHGVYMQIQKVPLPLCPYTYILSLNTSVAMNKKGICVKGNNLVERKLENKSLLDEKRIFV